MVDPEHGRRRQAEQAKSHRPPPTVAGPAGATDAEFYREVWLELTRFIRRLRREGNA
jgi:hypothetical protein